MQTIASEPALVIIERSEAHYHQERPLLAPDKFLLNFGMDCFGSPLDPLAGLENCGSTMISLRKRRRGPNAAAAVV